MRELSTLWTNVDYDTEGIIAIAPEDICAKALKQYHLYLAEGPQEVKWAKHIR